jgi:hypothetical protein
VDHARYGCTAMAPAAAVGGDEAVCVGIWLGGWRVQDGWW